MIIGISSFVEILKEGIENRGLFLIAIIFDYENLEKLINDAMKNNNNNNVA